MQTPTPHHHTHSGGDLQSILDWLGRSHEGTEPQQHAEQLASNLLVLRHCAIPNSLRIQLLDLLFKQIEWMVSHLLPTLPRQNLPVGHRTRVRIGTTLKALEIQAQEHLNTLAECFNEGQQLPPLAGHPLFKVMQCLTWSILISNLCHAPTRTGIWRSLHAALATARKIGIEQAIGECGKSLSRLYSEVLLAQMAQPTSLNALEFRFVVDYLAGRDTLPQAVTGGRSITLGLYWIDSGQDMPGQAFCRRRAPPETAIDYLACDDLACLAGRHLTALQMGRTPQALGLPEFAGTLYGHQILARLAAEWGNPPKRRFPRRKQTFRLHLKIGLPTHGEGLPHRQSSEWMIVNASPNGYALMHVAGQIDDLALGQVATLTLPDDSPITGDNLQIGLIRWTLSDNPEHVEIGIELLASQTHPARAIQPRQATPEHYDSLLLPPIPPARDYTELLTRSPNFEPRFGAVVVMLEHKGLTVREYQLERLIEQTGHIALWRVSPVETY